VPGVVRDAYRYGVVAASRDAAKVTVRPTAERASSGNQAYVAMALLRASVAAGARGDADRAADYLRTAKEILLYVGRQRQAAGALAGFVMNDATDVRSCEHNIDLAWAFGHMFDQETDAELRDLWQGWRDHAETFRNAMYGGNPRFADPPLDWIGDDWEYFHAGTGQGDDINQDLVPIDTGAWSALARDDRRAVPFDLLKSLAGSTDAGGRVYHGFDPGFRAVADETLTSRRDGVGSEVTAYMALITRALGDTAVLAALPDAGQLTPDEAAARQAIAEWADAGTTDHDLADRLLRELGTIQVKAPNGDGLGLVAAPVQGVGTGEYDLVNGWSLAATSWACFAYRGWNPFTDSTVH